MSMLSTFVLALFLAANGPATAPAPRPALKPTPAPRTVTACIASRQSDIEDVLGQLVSRIQEELASSESSCDYTVGSGKVTVTLIRSKEKLDVAREVEALLAAFPGSKLREIPGVGSRAFFLELAGAGAQVHIIRNSHDYLLVSVLGLGEPARIAPFAEQIARKALARLSPL